MVVGADRQSALMSKITNDDLTRSGTEDSMSLIPKWQQWTSKGWISSWLVSYAVEDVCLSCLSHFFISENG